MAVDVIVDQRAAAGVSRQLSWFRSLLGALMIAVGTTAMFPAMIIFLGWLASLFVKYEPTDWTEEVWLLGWCSVGLWILGTGAGMPLLKGRRRMVLFLRRFRFSDASLAVSSATNRLGGTWRFVTLDDAGTAPLGVAANLRRVHSISDWLARTGTAIRPVVVVSWKGLLTLSGVVAVGRVIWLSTNGGTLRSILDFSDPWLAGAATVFAALLALYVAGLALLIAGIPLIGVWALAADVMKDVEVAELARKRAIASSADIARVASDVRGSSTAVIAPRLAILEVDTDVWRPTVTAMAATADLVLIDVSRPSENLLWEIDSLLASHPNRCVFIGDFDRLGRFTGRSTVEPLTARAGALLAAWERALDGQQVIAYSTGRKQMRQFTRSLQQTFDAKRPRRPLTTGAVAAQLTQWLAVAGFVALVVFAWSSVQAMI